MQNAQRHFQVLQTMADRAPAAKVTWAEQWDELKAMWADDVPAEQIAETLNRSLSAVMTQVARLGLGRREAPGRKAVAPKFVQKTNVIMFKGRIEDEVHEVVAAPRHEKKDRTCLMCSTSFTSHGSHNRICPRCKTGAAYQVGEGEAYRLLSA